MKYSSLKLIVALCAAALGTVRAETVQPPREDVLPLRAAPHNHIALSKSALGREFLISASVIPQLVAATSTALAGKIVRFELFHDGVDMYESSEGLVVTTDLPTRRLLTTFPVVSQDENSLVLDFNAGMRRVFNDIWYVSSETPALGRAPLNQARTLEIPQGRVFEVRAEGEQLVIRQSAQVRDRQNDPNKEERFEIRYFLTPYKPGDFESKEQNPAAARYVRFFESYPRMETTTGRTSSKIALFDTRTPVLIHYSANTPAEFEGAVRDGILYWNRAFGREVVRVEKAPEGVSAPDPRFSLVQWVPWDNAGFAYADVIVDPRSGVSQRGQAFMTSTFAIVGKARARELLRNMRSAVAVHPPTAPKHDAHPEAAPSASPNALPLFSSARACETDFNAFAESYASALEAALASPGFDDAAAKRVAGDYVREVVAHEVGHVLGLRHNFAASLSGTLSPKELADWFNAYLADDDTKLLEDRIPSSSVMDYLDLRASAFVGRKIRKTAAVLPHDAAAIRWGYLANNEVVEKRMLFGTDQDVRTYGDVLPSDFGAEPLVGAYAVIGNEIKNLPHSLLEQFIAAKAPRDPRDKRPLEQLSLDPERASGRIADAYGRLLSWFSAGQRSLRVERNFPFVSPLNKREVLRAHWKALNEQIDKLGGVDRAVFSFLPLDFKLELKTGPAGVDVAEKIDAKLLVQRLGTLLESPQYTQFTGLDDQPASFSKEEKELIMKRGRLYFEEFEKDVLKRLCQKLEKAQRDLGVQAFEEVGEDDVVAKLERRIVDLAREVVLVRNEEKRHRGKVDKASVEVADFRYDLDTRLTACRMLADGAGSFRSWATEARNDLGKALKDGVDASLNAQNFREFKDAQLSRPLRDWYLNQQTVLGVLGYKPMPVSAGPQRQ